MLITIDKPKGLIFDITDKQKLVISFVGGPIYHERLENGKVIVYFPVSGQYESNYEPIKETKIHRYYEPNYRHKHDVNLVQGDFSSPVAFIDIDKNCIFVCSGFSRLNYQHQIAIIEHERAHIIAGPNEQLADDIAAKNYLKQGFNQSQFLFCIKQNAPMAYDRFNSYFKKLNEVKI